jgi:hypothetical protein
MPTAAEDSHLRASPELVMTGAGPAAPNHARLHTGGVR